MSVWNGSERRRSLDRRDSKVYEALVSLTESERSSRPDPPRRDLSESPCHVCGHSYNRHIKTCMCCLTCKVPGCKCCIEYPLWDNA